MEGRFVCVQDTGLLQFDMFLAVLEVDAAEGGGDFGAEQAAVEGEDTRVVDGGLHLDFLDTDGATDMGERYRVAARNGGVEVAVVLEDTGAAGRDVFHERGSRGHGDVQFRGVAAGAAARTAAGAHLRGVEGHSLIAIGERIPCVAADGRGAVGGLHKGAAVLQTAHGDDGASVDIDFLALLAAVLFYKLSFFHPLNF